VFTFGVCIDYLDAARFLLGCVILWDRRGRRAAVAAPVAVRYAWADNPVANLRNKEGLPVDPFRTDDWPLSTEPKVETKAP
jgi:hypothetical protein